MDISHLSYFSSLCETLSYTEAARNCFISRQAMRQSVQMLEQTFGVKLIENNRNRLSVSPAGQLLYEKTQPVLQGWRELNEAMQGCIVSDTPLRIGVSRSVTPFYAPEILEALERFKTFCSGIPTEITLHPTDKLPCLLQGGAIDAALLVDMDGSVFDAPAWRRTVLRSDEMTLTLSTSNPLASRSHLTLADLDGRTVMLMAQPEQFFHPLYAAAEQADVHIHWKIIPDLYEVYYHLLQTDWLALDRLDSIAVTSTDLDRDLRFEDGAFTLRCCLVSPAEESAVLRILRQTLLESRRIRHGKIIHPD